MNRALRTIVNFLLVLVGGSSLAFAQGVNGQANLSRAVGIYNSQLYQYGAYILNGNSATGSQTITVCPALVTLADGRQINPWGTNVPIIVDPQSTTAVETVTPSAVSQVTPSNAPGNIACENITATFSNAHGASFNPAQVISGDQGINEAINDAAANGGGDVFWQIDSGALTLSTGGQTTNASAILIPTRSVVSGATAIVKTTITGCAGGWSLGHTSGVEFGAANTTLTAGTTTDSSTLVPNYVFNVAAHVPIVFCTTGAATAGVVHARYWGHKLVAPLT